MENIKVQISRACNWSQEGLDECKRLSHQQKTEIIDEAGYILIAGDEIENPLRYEKLIKSTETNRG